MQKIGKTNRNSSGILSVAVAILLCTTLLTGHVISGTMAKYVTQGTADSGSARVASFSVAATGDNDSLSLSVGGTVTYTITLNNQSEVAVKPIVSVTFTSDISNYLVVKLKNRNASSVSVSYDKTTLTWSDVSEMYPGDTEIQLPLTITTDAALPGQLSDVSSDSYTGSFPFDTQVTFVQID